MDFKVGDKVKIKRPFWWLGDNLGDYLGTVIDTKGYILVMVYDYKHNPVKCFRNEIELLTESSDSEDCAEYFFNIFGI